MIGFAAETEHLIENAKAKFARKGCDWIVANDVSPATGVMGGDRNTVHLLTRGKAANITVDSWPVMTKEQVAAELVARIGKAMEKSIMSTIVKVESSNCRTARAWRCRPIRAPMPRASICSPRCRKTRR